MTPKEYEQYIANIFQKQGYKTDVHQVSYSYLAKFLLFLL